MAQAGAEKHRASAGLALATAPAETGGALVTAVAEDGRLRASLGRQRQGEGMKRVKVKHPLPSSYRTSWGSRRVHLTQFSLFLASLAQLAFLQFKIFSLNISNI